MILLIITRFGKLSFSYVFFKRDGDVFVFAGGCIVAFMGQVCFSVA